MDLRAGDRTAVEYLQVAAASMVAAPRAEAVGRMVGVVEVRMVAAFASDR